MADEPTTIEKAIEALQVKAEFTRDDVISERTALIRKMIQVAGWLEGDPKAEKDMRSHLESVKSRLDKLIEYESERAKLHQADKDLAEMAGTIEQKDKEITRLNQAFDAMRTNYTNRGVSIDGLKNQILTLTTKIKVGEFDSVQRLRQELDIMTTQRNLCLKGWGDATQPANEKIDGFKENIAWVTRQLTRKTDMSDRWKRAALKRTKKIKALEAQLDDYRYWQGHAARCSYLYHKSEAKLRRAGRRIKALKDDLAAGTMLDVMLKFLDK